MNLNRSLVNKAKTRSRVGAPNFSVMGPPVRPPSKRKTNSSVSSATNWGRNPHSLLNNWTLRSASTSVSVEVESRVIIAITEGRGDARCEVGLASIELSHPSLILCQISDSQSYINTLTKINILNPTDIILPSTFLETATNRLVDKLKKQFPKVKILSAPRKTFNKTNGMDRILQLCLPSINTICVGLQHKYYALAAAFALLTYLQNNLNVYYANASINVSYQESEGYAVIDVATADRLELVSSAKPAQASRYSTLFGVLNHCYTKIGSRLLRSTILQPPSSPTIIEETSSCVAELLKHPQMLLSIQGIVQKISSIDQLLTITTMSYGTSDSCSVRQLNYLLFVNAFIDLIEPLKNVIEHCQQPFFKELMGTLMSENFSVITEQIRKTIHPSAQFARGEGGMTQRCFAIKSGINGLLDLIRKTYSERLNDMTEYVKCLGRTYNLPLTLANNNVKGYHIVLKLTGQQKRSFKKSDLPPEFIQVYRLAGSCTMKTAELINYSTRLEDIMLEILKISNLMINKTIVELKEHIAFFYKLSEDVARLDMLQSLAESSRRGNYVRPKFGSFTELTGARHPMLELLIGEQRVSNPISVCEDFNVQIITGPNGSGKSIYIRQVMLLQVMAQVGCYVPADSAIFRPMTRMFARVYLEDNMEYNASSFILEMREVKYMMTLMSENSLFIVDELCRSTAADEGAALATAICEKFCHSSVFLFVTTHYTELAKLADMYLNVKTWQMETIAVGDTPQDLNLDFRYRLVPGVTNLKHYGVYIVENIWPDSILREVYNILNSLKETVKNTKVIGVDERVRLKYKLESDMRKLKSRGKLTRTVINELLNDYRDKLQQIGCFVDLKVVSDVGLNLDFYERSPVPSPEDDNLVVSPEFVRSALETSSYQNLSNFLREDSDNINKLVPEISISSSQREFNVMSLYPNQPPGVSEVVPLNTQSTNCSDTEDSLNIRKSVENDKIQSISTPTLWGLGQPEVDIDLESIMDDLQSCMESIRDDEEFDFSQASYKTASQNVNSQTNLCEGVVKNYNDQHIFPIVKVIEGTPWDSDTSTSSESPKRKETLEASTSISYSPLCSQEDDNKTSNKEQTTTSTSSLQFVASTRKLDDDSTNLDSISMNRAIDNITVENLKSISDEKHSGSSADLERKDQVTVSSSLKESDKSEEPVITKKNKTQRPQRPKRFIPPKKLTKKEIQQEFDEQDRKLYETSVTNSDFSKYLTHILNRPSVRQVQESKHLALVRRTENGVEVIPARESPKKPKRPLFKRNLSTSSNVDVTIFSDQNAEYFDQFVNSTERDMKRFRFNLEGVKEKCAESQQFNFQPQSLSDYAAGGKLAFSFKKGTQSSDSNGQFVTPSTPDGFYKQNKSDINNLVSKYLGGASQLTEQESCEEMNVFESCSLQDGDLDLS